MSEVDKRDLEAKGFYKLSWVQRFGFASGDLAQNLIYQTVASQLMFFCTDVYILGGDRSKAAGIASTLMLIVRFVDMVWDPIVGAFIDKHHPRWGKYRSYLIIGGIPLTVFSALTFWNKFAPSVPYIYITYILLSLSYTLVNVPYGAINSSLTRDNDEITMLTSLRMWCANIGCFFVYTLLFLFIAIVGGTPIPWDMILFNLFGNIPNLCIVPFMPAIKNLIGKKNMFYVFLTVAVAGNAILYIASRMNANDWWYRIGNLIKSTGVCVATGYQWALVPEVISYGEWKTGRRISAIVNAITGLFFKAGFALGGAIPGWIIQASGYVSPPAGESTLPKDPMAWFTTLSIYFVIGFIILIFCFTQTKERVVMEEGQVDSVKVSDFWTEFARNPPLVVVSLFFIVSFVMQNISNTSNNYLMNDLYKQKPSAQEAIRWTVCVIPGILAIVCMIIISRYSLTDDKIEKINKEIEERNAAKDSA
jgi:Na+/melibiose symporter-like transporter